MNLFVKTNDKTVFFLAFDGRGYLDNPKAIFEGLLADLRFCEYQFVWGMNEQTKIDGAKRVKKGSIQYFYYLSKAKYWVVNAKMPEYFVKKSDQIYLQTWHGTPLKRLAHDLPDNGLTYYRSKQSYREMTQSYDKDSKLWDYLISATPFSTEVFTSAFQLPREKIIETGYPRNDVLVTASESEIKQIKAKYQLPSDKKVILYAPTWRDNTYNLKGYTFELQVDFTKWREVLGQEYVILFKPHYLIASRFQVPTDLTDFVYELPANDEISDLYLISDVLITDYSSVFFDYAILNRPIYFYMSDFATYKNDLRGFYLSVPKDLPNDICQSEDDLLEAINSGVFDYQRLSEFNQKFNQLQDGMATKRVIKEVFG
ncbi:teichoic acid biosynthesis protein F [Lactococcus hodotermopsidis]|uniref:Teichoic acid biosynthesis protein F n=2 Tax=Pseudolactococcus hodotermopsidis TaxID=2709157 RepID=A0A6A0BD18_9LACT|nr:teichoic acid biosynthesis protein F [Lactococcus hodotermopsidis]